MPLSCYCSEESDYYYDKIPEDFSKLETSRRKRCNSCRQLINIGDEVLKIPTWRYPNSDIEDKIYYAGGQVPLAPRYLCAKCGEIFLNLTEYGYCVNIEENMHDLLRDHWEYTDFVPKEEEGDQTRSC